MLKRRILCIVLCTILLLFSAPSVFATEDGNILRLTSVYDFMIFAENCRLDSYSSNLTVMLCKDLDLTGVDFSGIPIFCGTFLGRGHTISGLNIVSEGSNIGFFRYLTQSARVEELKLAGTVAPKGSGSAVGALAANNAGKISGCSFNGTVSGISSVGGLVGINQVSGVIEESNVSGSVNGTHFVGGITGENYGTIRFTHNRADVNTSLAQNQIDLEDITLDFITSSESAATITDVGGICGNGTGVIRECTNHGNIGYPKIGYNIGGIAGSFNGYIFYAINYGAISGRKDVGGILGQLEPAMHILYEEDTLQTLEQQLNTMSDLTGNASSHAQSGSSALDAQAKKMEQQVKDAQEALDILLSKDEDENKPQLDADEIQAAQNALTSSITGMTESLRSMVSISKNTLSLLSQDIQSISVQMNAIGGTIGSAADNMGGTITDASDSDTPDDRTAKIQTCQNNGTISGEWNIGGIVGSVAFENDMDPESDIHLLGQSSYNFDIEMRAVIRNCSNLTDVICSKQNAGGIIGWMSLGLVHSCKNIATLDAPSATYVGGIVGFSNGHIRHCSAKSVISGNRYVGGISGRASVVTNCHAIVSLSGVLEKSGAILGTLEDAQLEGNYYLVTDRDIGAVDGISYDTMAQPLSDKSFFASSDVPHDFRNATVTFLLEDRAVQVSVPFGHVLSSDKIPVIPTKSGSDGYWNGSVSLNDKIFFDAVFTPAFVSHDTTLQSNVLSTNGKPVFLIQGDFIPGSVFKAESLEDSSCVDAWELQFSSSTVSTKIRYLIPDGYTPKELRLLTNGSGKDWIDTPFQVDGSYLVFSTSDSHISVRLELIPKNHLVPLIVGAVGCVLLFTFIFVALKKRKRQ